ncbi:helix-turn-helix domain-containing protein [Confluentibacter sediminis]|uniref:helix-turn-helix domain-containing protein n=1 Tax=Confluentibacter sediminis TaxID=2219045 RepID=UPI000DAEDBFA|nr:HTH domain-containing protein [Confluentibacter sediminis]
MTYSERKEKEAHLLYLIEHKRLSNLEKIANDYGCSVRTVERMLKELREEGYNISFCRKSNKYLIKN